MNERRNQVALWELCDPVYLEIGLGSKNQDISVSTAYILIILLKLVSCELKCRLILQHWSTGGELKAII